jgi:hypothetical protein
LQLHRNRVLPRKGELYPQKREGSVHHFSQVSS